MDSSTCTIEMSFLPAAQRVSQSKYRLKKSVKLSKIVFNYYLQQCDNKMAKEDFLKTRVKTALLIAAYEAYGFICRRRGKY